MYARCGFGCVEVIPADMEWVDGQEGERSKEDIEKWRKLVSEDLSGWLIWRPVGRDFVEGVDRALWVVDRGMENQGE
jgi:hypothetical protein